MTLAAIGWPDRIQPALVRLFFSLSKANLTNIHVVVNPLSLLRLLFFGHARTAPCLPLSRLSSSGDAGMWVSVAFCSDCLSDPCLRPFPFLSLLLIGQSKELIYGFSILCVSGHVSPMDHPRKSPFTPMSSMSIFELPRVGVRLLSLRFWLDVGEMVLTQFCLGTFGRSPRRNCDLEHLHHRRDFL